MQVHDRREDAEFWEVRFATQIFPSSLVNTRVIFFHYLLAVLLLCRQTNRKAPFNISVTTAMISVSRSIASFSRQRNSLVARAIRAKSTQVEEAGDGPLAADGRHENWREGIYDHDNEPK